MLQLDRRGHFRTDSGLQLQLRSLHEHPQTDRQACRARSRQGQSGGGAAVPSLLGHSWRWCAAASVFLAMQSHRRDKRVVRRKTRIVMLNFAPFFSGVVFVSLSFRHQCNQEPDKQSSVCKEGV